MGIPYDGMAAPQAVDDVFDRIPVSSEYLLLNDLRRVCCSADAESGFPGEDDMGHGFGDIVDKSGGVLLEGIVPDLVPYSGLPMVHGSCAYPIRLSIRSVERIGWSRVACLRITALFITRVHF